jgi:hypothetical protein
VFVDATGRRRRRVRRIAYAIGAACLTYTGLVGASVIGHPARPGALAPFQVPADRPRPAVHQPQPPERPTTGVPLPAGDGPDIEAVPVRLQRRAPDKPPTPSPPSALAAPRTESTPLPSPPTEPPAPTDPPPPEPTDPPEPPEPEPTDPPVPEPTEPPAPEPGPTVPAEEPAAELPLVGPILGLLSGGSAQR